ncbi:hypothetical protein HDU96_010187 [Phlyctochytrium bullatum]|nr:hypothetical protein HDU96_010187 [Phlyctochytrium bullatum]
MKAYPRAAVPGVAAARPILLLLTTLFSMALQVHAQSSKPCILKFNGVVRRRRNLVIDTTNPNRLTLHLRKPQTLSAGSTFTLTWTIEDASTINSAVFDCSQPFNITLQSRAVTVISTNATTPLLTSISTASQSATVTIPGTLTNAELAYLVAVQPSATISLNASPANVGPVAIRSSITLPLVIGCLLALITFTSAVAAVYFLAKRATERADAAIGNTSAFSVPPLPTAALEAGITGLSGAKISEKEMLDFTCCDHLAEIVARNVLLLSLAIDGTVEYDIMWKIYHDLKLDDISLQSLGEQTKKLLLVAQTTESWRESSYGKVIRFCDASTLEMMVPLWEIYAVDPSGGVAFTKLQKNIKVELERTKRSKERTFGTEYPVVINGLRSTSPCEVLCGDDVPEIFNSFWKTGLTSFDTTRVSRAKHYNPMYATLKDTATLHFGQDPLSGYHLATAVAELEETSSFLPSKATQGLDRYTTAAKLQFAVWLKAFRAGLSKIIVRFCVADTLAFSHVLQYQHVHGESEGAAWYRWTSTFASLELDPDEYTSESKNSAAPTKFDVIDTSNLVDHLGGLNVIAAASPLLKANPSAAFFIELLGKHGKNVEEYLQKLVCGDLPTIALLLGLVPIEYWTGATGIFRSDVIAEMLFEGTNQSWFKMVWRSRGQLSVEWEPNELADLCYRLYLEMLGLSHG